MMGDFITGIFASLGALFVIGTLSFWVISLAIFFLLTWFTEDDKDVLATLCVGVFIWTAATVNDFSVFVNPLLWVKWFGIYLIVGCLWSFIKWFSFLHRAKDRLQKLKASFAKHNPTLVVDNKVTDEGFPRFAKHLYENNYVSQFISPNGYSGNERTIQERSDVIPSVREQFGSLVGWIVWWPMSAFWTLLNDPIRRLAEFLVRSLKGAYTQMGQAVFRNEV
jgi:hypothetical protein